MPQASDPVRDDTGDFCGTRDRAALARRQLAALAERESVVRAFVCTAPPGPAQPGPLSGALIGVKDVISTAGFPTRHGADGPGHCGPDAWCVAEVKRLGGAILGKTVCTEFAYPVPGPTTNPHDPTRSPGGSSSGSAAAVAAGFVSFAFGTQTAGSTIRPASYCGVTGLKPSYGLLPMDGIQPMSTTLDHLGVFAHSPRDAWFLVSALALATPELACPRRPDRVLIWRPPAEIPMQDGYLDLIEALPGWLARDGVHAELADLPFPVSDLAGLQQALCYWELARLLRVPGPIRLVPQLQALVSHYAALDLAPYAAARARRQAAQAQFAAVAAEYDAVLLPAATGAAPPHRSTGDAVLNRLWTALHIPVFSVPMWRTPAGLPLGLQILGGLGQDRSLAEVAQYFWERRQVRTHGRNVA